MFDEDASLQNALNNFVSTILYNDYTGKLWDPTYINSWDREEWGEQFADAYMNVHKERFEDDNEDNTKEKLSIYAAKEIDRLIPKVYFMEVNHELMEKYTPLLVRRIYDTQGKDGFKTVSDIEYKYDHDFTDRKKVLDDTKATPKQVDYLKKLGKDNGYLFWNEEYLSKTYANQMIEYLTEKTYEEPGIFSFFFVAK